VEEDVQNFKLEPVDAKSRTLQDSLAYIGLYRSGMSPVPRRGLFHLLLKNRVKKKINEKLYILLRCSQGFIPSECSPNGG
jgi:hypothetical protein